MAARRQITQAQLAKWPKATKSEKSAILDAVCAVTGWHRDHARRSIRVALAERAGGGPRPRQKREPVLTYGEHAIELLTRCWAPEPDFKLGGSPIWYADTIRDWHRDRPSQRADEA